MSAKCQQLPYAPQQAASLFDDLVGADEQCSRNADAKCFRRLEVYDQFRLRGLLNRKVGRLLTLENATGIRAGQSIHVRLAASVANQTASGSELAKLIDGRHGVAQ